MTHKSRQHVCPPDFFMSGKYRPTELYNYLNITNYKGNELKWLLHEYSKYFKTCINVRKRGIFI